MRKITLIITLLFAVSVAGTAVASPFAKVKSCAGKTMAEQVSRASNTVQLIKHVGGFYDPSAGASADYYFMLSDKESATYNAQNGISLKDGLVLFLDLWAGHSTPISLPDGVYTASEGNGDMTYDPNYTYLAYYGNSGEQEKNAFFSSPITVSSDESGNYTVTAETVWDGVATTITYHGRLPFEDTSEQPSVYNQINENLNLSMNGALAFYDGNLYQSNTGAMYINLYDHAFNSETGGMTEEGFSLALMVFNKLFSDPSEAMVLPGTYTMARNFNRDTWYPGIEVDYMGVTVILGCYAKEMNQTKYNDGFGYSYLEYGTVDIEDAGDGKMRITVDAVTTHGHTVKAVFEGEIPVIDKSDPNDKPSSISTLEDDVKLDLEKIKTAHIWNDGIRNGCQAFIVDIGSPSGRDSELDDGGDIIRLEFLLEEGEKYLKEGTYTVMDTKYEYSYAPFKMMKGYFNTNDLTGTRYMHFEEGRYYIMDHYAPVESGSVGVTCNPDGTYRFDIALMCDANFHIDGTWSGPVELMYNPENITSGIDGIESDSLRLEIVYLDKDTLELIGASDNAVVSMYTVSGSPVHFKLEHGIVDISNLAAGIYIMNVNGKSIKVVKR